MAYRSHEYGDPSDILERQERMTCKGCKHKGVLLGKESCWNPKNRKVRYLDNGKLRRCDKYDNGEGE